MKTKLLTLMLILFGFLSSINANAQCVASFTVTPDSANPGNYFFTNTSPGPYDYAVWSFGDGTSSYALAPYHSYNSVGHFVACLTVYDSSANCQTSSCDTVNVGTAFPTCSANFSFLNNGTGAVSFTNSSVSSTGIITNYYWSFGDGSNSTAANPVHTYSQAGIYNVCLFMTDSSSGCANQTCKQVIIAGAAVCDASFGVADSGMSAYFYPTNANANNYTFQWNFGDGTSSTLSNPSHTYAQSGIYGVCLTITNFLGTCTDTYCDTAFINVSPSCQATYTYQTGAGNSVYFTAYNPMQNIISYVWNFGDGSPLDYTANPVHTYPGPGQYNVCFAMQTSLGCADSACQIITVSQTCDASFSTFDSTGYTYFIPVVNNNSVYYYWSFGDGSSSTQMIAVHHYTGNGPWTACLTIVDSIAMCSNQQCQTISNPTGGNCAASFSSNVTAGTTIAMFTNTSTGNFTYSSWSFGDGTSSSSANPGHTYSGQGTYVVCLTVYNNVTGCQSSFCDSVVVGNGSANQCVPQFYSYPDSSVFSNGVVYFGILNSCPGSTFTWQVNGAVFGTGLNPVYQFPDSGWYEICVTGVTPNGTFVTCDSVYSQRLAQTTGISEIGNQIPLSVSPNPSNGPMKLSFFLTESENVTIQLMSIDGREVINYQEQLSAGIHQHILNTENIAGGIYLVRLQAAGKQSISRVAIQH